MFKVVSGFAVLATLALAGGANAAITVLPAGQLSPGGSVVTFDSPARPNGTLLGNVTLGGIQFSGGGKLYTGTVGGVSATPFGDSTQYLTVLGGKSETLTFSAPMTRFGLFWGSLDSYNSIAFYNGSTQVASYGGNAIAAATGLTANGGQFSTASNRYVQFAFGSGQSFDRVVLASSGNSFEFDNISAGVPEPSTWAMMLVGFAGLGFAARRRKAIATA